MAGGFSAAPWKCGTPRRWWVFLPQRNFTAGAQDLGPSGGSGDIPAPLATLGSCASQTFFLTSVFHSFPPITALSF